MAARYQHLSPVFLSEAVKKLDSVFGAAATLGDSSSDSIVTVALPDPSAGIVHEL